MTTTRPRKNRKLRQPDEGEAKTEGGLFRKVLAAMGRALPSRRRPRRAVSQQRAVQKKVPGNLRPSKGFIWIWACAVALAATSFVFHLNVRFEIIQQGYALSRAQGEQRRLRLGQRELRLELATLKAPDRVEQQARENLGMERPGHDRIIRLGRGGRRSRVALRRR